eukprot:COSAG04_NODE_2678_length_3745_cov_7.789358_1_plen_166_part_00
MNALCMHLGPRLDSGPGGRRPGGRRGPVRGEGRESQHGAAAAPRRRVPAPHRRRGGPGDHRGRALRRAADVQLVRGGPAQHAGEPVGGGTRARLRHDGVRDVGRAPGRRRNPDGVRRQGRPSPYALRRLHRPHPAPSTAATPPRPFMLHCFTRPPGRPAASTSHH